MYPKQTTPDPQIAAVLNAVRDEAAQHGLAQRITIPRALFDTCAKKLRAAGIEPAPHGSYAVELNGRRLLLLQPGAAYDRYSAATYVAKDGETYGIAIRNAVEVMNNERPGVLVKKLTAVEKKRVFEFLTYTAGFGKFEKALAVAMVQASPEQLTPLLIGFPELIHKAFK